jgi:hypothetical protein
MLARGTQPPVLGEVEVGVIVQLHLKRRHKNVTNLTTKAQKVNTAICIKRTAVSNKMKIELLPKKFVSELNTKNLGNSANFLTTMQTTPFAKRFRENGILMIDIAAEICPWAEQPQTDLQFLVLD